MKPNPKAIVALTILAGLIVGGYRLDEARRARESNLTGIFETTPAKLSSRLGGRVAKILVRDGEAVKAGQALVEFEAVGAMNDLEASKAATNQAEARLRELEHGTRIEDLDRQAAVVAEARAALDKAIAGPLPEEIASAEHKAREAEAHFELVRRGARPEDVAAALAAQAEARAKLDAAERGPTPEERAQLDARYRSALAEARQARRDAERHRRLFDEGAVSGAVAENSALKAHTAEEKSRDAKEALDRALRGTPPEELDQARSAYDRAHSQYLSVANGSRPEDVRAAREAMESAREQVRLLRRGTRAEDVAAARARLAQAEAQLASLRHGTRPEQLAQAEAAHRAAMNQTSSLRERTDERVVRAPRDGVVERVLVAQGDLIGAGGAVIQFVDPDDVWVKVFVTEERIARITVGSAAALRVDGLADAFDAKVDQIASQGEYTPVNLQTPEERGRQVFAVRLRLARPDRRVKPGLGVNVIRLGAP